MKLCTGARKALLKGVERGDALQELHHLGYNQQYINTLEGVGLMYLSDLLKLTDKELLQYITQRSFNKLQEVLNQYDFLKRPTANLELDLPYADEYEKQRIRADIRLEVGSQKKIKEYDK